MAVLEAIGLLNNLVVDRWDLTNLDASWHITVKKVVTLIQ